MRRAWLRDWCESAWTGSSTASSSTSDRLPLSGGPLPVPPRLPRPFHAAPVVITAIADLTNWRDVRELHRSCTRVIGKRPTGLVIDLSSVTDADSKLVACLVAVARRARRSGVPIAFQMSTTVTKWIDLCRVHPVLV